MDVIVLEIFRFENENNRLRVRDLTERFFAYSLKTDTLDSLIVLLTDLVPVVQKLASAIHRVNRYPENKYYENQLRYPLVSNLSSG